MIYLSIYLSNVSDLILLEPSFVWSVSSTWTAAAAAAAARQQHRGCRPTEGRWDSPGFVKPRPPAGCWVRGQGGWAELGRAGPGRSGRSDKQQLRFSRTVWTLSALHGPQSASTQPPPAQITHTWAAFPLHYCRLLVICLRARFCSAVVSRISFFSISSHFSPLQIFYLQSINSVQSNKKIGLISKKNPKHSKPCLCALPVKVMDASMYCNVCFISSILSTAVRHWWHPIFEQDKCSYAEKSWQIIRIFLWNVGCFLLEEFKNKTHLTSFIVLMPSVTLPLKSHNMILYTYIRHLYNWSAFNEWVIQKRK